MLDLFYLSELYLYDITEWKEIHISSSEEDTDNHNTIQITVRVIIFLKLLLGLVQSSGCQWEAILTLSGHLIMYDVFWGAMASIGYRPGTLLNILQYTGQRPTAKNYLVPNANSVGV